jgi:hypothetical protein
VLDYYRSGDEFDETLLRQMKVWMDIVLNQHSEYRGADQLEAGFNGSYIPNAGVHMTRALELYQNNRIRLGELNIHIDDLWTAWYVTGDMVFVQAVLNTRDSASYPQLTRLAAKWSYEAIFPEIAKLESEEPSAGL